MLIQLIIVSLHAENGQLYRKNNYNHKRQQMRMTRKFLLWLVTITIMTSGTSMLTSCSSDDDNGVNNTVNPDNTWVEPTTDQLGVRVTVDVPAVSLSQFTDKSVGTALIKRLPKVNSAIADDTEFVLIKGSDISSLSDAVTAQVANVLAIGGYVAIERPTDQQLDDFLDKIEEAIAAVVKSYTDDLFELTPEQTEATVNASMAGRMSIRRVALASSMRATSADKACAELIIFGPEDTYFEEPLDDHVKVTSYCTDTDGNTMEEEKTETIEIGEVTEYHYGLIADGAAQWVNDTEAQHEDEDAWYQVDGSSRRVSRRASGMTAINDIMDATETFTKSSQVYFRPYNFSINKNKNEVIWQDRVMTTLRTWGVHHGDYDFYYVNQNVLLGLGKSDGLDPFFTRYFAPQDWLEEIDKDGNKTGNRWYGNFLTQYETSMDLQGVDSKSTGTIVCMAATPETANQVTTQSVNARDFHSSTSSTTHSVMTTVGWISGGFGGNVKYDYTKTKGVTDGNSFSMTNSKSIKDLDVVKNTAGTKVTWTYNGKRPKTSGPGNVIHESPADILVNDANLVNDACWSVQNPTGQFSVNVGSIPTTGVLKLNGKGEAKVYETKTTFDNIWNVPLVQPCRSIQKWRMLVRVLEWKDGPMSGIMSGAQSDFQQMLMNKFPDIFQSTFEIGELTPESVKNATAYILYSQQVFEVYKDILQGIAKSFGIKKFRITWSSDKNLETKQGYEVTVE